MPALPEIHFFKREEDGAAGALDSAEGSTAPDFLKREWILFAKLKKFLHTLESSGSWLV